MPGHNRRARLRYPLACLACLFLLSSCGQTGPLYLPPAPTSTPDHAP